MYKGLYKLRRNEKMKKRIVFALVAAVAVVSLMGCNVTTTKTYTETTTETTESGPAEETEEAELTVATIAFDNETNFDFAELYFSPADSDDWGDNILGDDAPLAVGEMITYNNALTYSEDSAVWDIKAVDADGNNVEFDGADMLTASDAENIDIVFEYDAENESYSATIQ